MTTQMAMPKSVKMASAMAIRPRVLIEDSCTSNRFFMGCSR